MKKIILVFLMLSPCFAFSQKVEFGFGGGISTNTQPAGNMYYLGDQGTINYAASVWALYNSWTGWQLGINIHELELSATSTKVYTDATYPTITYGGDDKRFVYSTYTTSLCGIVNKKILAGKNDIYMGFAVGFALAKNDANNRSPNESYKAPDNGNGAVLGMQAGYNYNFNSLTAFNLDIAARYYDLHYGVTAPHMNTSSNLNYQIWSFPVTIGLRFRIQSADRGNPVFNYDRYQRHHQRFFKKHFFTSERPDNATDSRSKIMKQ